MPCRLLLPTFAVAALMGCADAGSCDFDSDCPLDDICVDGACVAPMIGMDAGPGGSDAGPGETDAGAGGTDAGPGGPDAGPGGGDAGPGADDGGTFDAGAVDAGASDAGAPDAGAPDAGAPDAGAPDAGAPDAGSGPRCVFVDVTCNTGAPIRDFCPSERPVEERLRRCDDSLFTPGASYLDFELSNCACIISTAVSWRQVECCRP